MTERPRLRQAVILAGGQGTRLRPLTNDRPKPMVLVNGRPFLEYLIELLRAQGIEEVVLLLGYLPEKITEHFGDGSRFGLRIRYSIGAVEDETGTRIRNAMPLFDDRLLLMYCDNYCPLDLESLLRFHHERNVPVTVTVYTNQRGVTKNNMVVDEQGYVVTYDRKRQAAGLNGVDLGFFLIDRAALRSMPADNFSFEDVVLPDLIARRQLAGFKTDHRYYSIGNIERLPTTERFLQSRKVILLDRDGVINEKAAKADYIKRWDEFKFLPGALEALRLLHQYNYEIYLITNQPGIARGMMVVADLEDIHTKMRAEIERTGGKVDGIFACLHGWNDGCDCRKPKPGLLFRAAHEHHFDLTKAVFIGDDERDVAAGQAANCRTILLHEKYDLLEAVRELLRSTETPLNQAKSKE